MEMYYRSVSGLLGGLCKVDGGGGGRTPCDLCDVVSAGSREMRKRGENISIKYQRCLFI